MIAIKIDGVEYRNVSSIKPSVVYDYYYDVKTMDGNRHRDIKGKRTNYEAEFYNGNFTEYDKLKTALRNAGIVTLEVPTGTDSSISGEYLVTVNGDELKGKLGGGQWYNTRLSVTFEKVGYDE
ncbi:MAG: hypothetical protein J6S14_13420 [Clostridia bacterium]|nr:hypothetical protein [Clostridia bacterium]